MRLLIALGLATALTATPAAAYDEAIAETLPAPGQVEVLQRDASGRPVLARVALIHRLPGWVEDRMALGGTWSYLIREPAGVVVFDVGPRYPLAWCLVPWSFLKADVPRLPNNAYIFAALERVYPGLPITSVVLSHWHPDHTEDAPALQQEAQSRYGTAPPLRIMPQDRPAHWRGLFPGGADYVFQEAGFKPGDWFWGEDLRDGAPIGQTGFRVLALPGHTRGTIALVNSRLRISLGPPPHVKVPRTTLWTEAKERYPQTVLKFYLATYGDRHYSTHPGRERLEYWPSDPPPDPHKLGERGMAAAAVRFTFPPKE